MQQDKIFEKDVSVIQTIPEPTSSKIVDSPAMWKGSNAFWRESMNVQLETSLKVILIKKLGVLTSEKKKLPREKEKRVCHMFGNRS